MEDPRIKQIRQCEERIRELEATAENRRREALWDDKCDENDCNWHPVPKDPERMPFSFEIERIGYSQMLGFSLVKFYADPVEFALRSLQISIFKFETFPLDCTPIAKSISYWPGVGYEASLMGLPQIYTEEDAWVGKDPVLKERVPLETIVYPGFFENEVMRQTHRFYGRMREILSEDFKIMFPQWCRSPWSVAWAIRGIDSLIYDYMDDPQWVEGLLTLLADYRIRFAQDRASYLGIPMSKRTNFYNDEVMSPVVSPTMYRELILPSEKRVAEAYGGINYWHSCGNTTSFMEDINTIPGVTMVHVSPWSDLWKAAKVYDPDKTIEVALNPLTEVMTTSSPEKARERILEIKEATKGRRSVCRADGFEVIHDVQTDIRILQDWMKMASQILM